MNSEARIREIVREEITAYDERRREAAEVARQAAERWHAEWITNNPPMRYQAGCGWQVDTDQANRIRAEAGLPRVDGPDLKLKFAQRIDDANEHIADAVRVVGGVATNDDLGQVPAELGGDRSVVVVDPEKTEDGTQRSHNASPSVGADTLNVGEERPGSG